MSALRHGVTVLSLAILVATAADESLAGTPEDDFLAAENTFRFQDYKGARARFHDLLYPNILLSNADQVLKAREYLGACLFWLNDEKGMEEEFTALLIQAPTYKLDPFYYPANLIDRFEALRTRLVELHIIDTGPRKKPVDEGPKCERIEETVVRRSRLVGFVPFGVGQFENGDTTGGVLFLTGQTLALGTNIAAFVVAERLRGPDGIYSASDAATARKLRYVQYAGLGVFAALAIWGIVDAQVRMKTTEKSIRLVPCPVPPAAPGPEGVSGRPAFAVCFGVR